MSFTARPPYPQGEPPVPTGQVAEWTSEPRGGEEKSSQSLPGF